MDFGFVFSQFSFISDEFGTHAGQCFLRPTFKQMYQSNKMVQDT